jgi:hypothetical protein
LFQCQHSTDLDLGDGLHSKRRRLRFSQFAGSALNQFLARIVRSERLIQGQAPDPDAVIYCGTLFPVLFADCADLRQLFGREV